MQGVATFPQLIPDVDDLLAMRPQELAPHVLRIAHRHKQNGIIHPWEMNALVEGVPALNCQGYPQHMQGAAKQAVAEAWQWLLANGLFVPDHQHSSPSGHVRLTRLAQELLKADSFGGFLKTQAFPKNLLHHSIADRVWGDLLRGEWDTASFKAFRAVEEAVRAAGGYGASEIGVNLMRKAFHPTGGPLTDPNQESGEQQGLSDLFAGTMGSYKNAHSHRTVTMVDPAEGYEHVLLASHLLRIVEARVAMRAAAPP